MLGTAALMVATLYQSTQIPVDPYSLRIGRTGAAVVSPGQIYDLERNRPASLDALVASAERKRFVYLGEQHATAAHQSMEADVIRALAEHGRDVIVGLEMYTRPKQDVLDQWSAGTLTEDQFLDQSDWKGQWGYPFDFYRPVFSAVRQFHLPLIGLNVPRTWVHTVAQNGLESLPTSARLQLPPKLNLDNRAHREVFDSLMGGHQMTGSGMDGMYQAQVLWDEAMADTAVKYLERRAVTPHTIFVVVAGAGHMLYGQGINYRIAKDGGGSGITLIMLQSDAPVKVSRGVADFVFVSPKPKEQGH